jgi:small subunit ribosomal protein S15
VRSFGGGWEWAGVALFHCTSSTVFGCHSGCGHALGLVVSGLRDFEALRALSLGAFPVEATLSAKFECSLATLSLCALLFAPIPKVNLTARLAGIETNMSQTATTDTKPFQINEKDTGSADVQIVRLTDRINHLTQHLSSNDKDNSSRRGLLAMVARRRKLLDYLKRTEESRYTNIIKALKLRR